MIRVAKCPSGETPYEDARFWIDGAPADALLFDSSHGDGETALRKGPWRTVLAGGVSADNVRAACASGADVVDVSGSLESAPGVKSVAKLAAFMSAADAARDL